MRAVDFEPPNLLVDPARLPEQAPFFVFLYNPFSNVPNLPPPIARLRTRLSQDMDQRTENKPWMAVPEFGGWDQKSGSPDYSMVFSRARANRKQVKTTINRASIGNVEELKALQQRHDDHHQPRKKIFTYLCCIRA